MPGSTFLPDCQATGGCPVLPKLATIMRVIVRVRPAFASEQHDSCLVLDAKNATELLHVRGELATNYKLRQPSSRWCGANATAPLASWGWRRF